MGVGKNRKSWWVSVRHAGVRYRKRSPENSRAGALAYEALIRYKLARGESLEPPKPVEKAPVCLFKDFVARWFTTYVVTNNKPSEQRSKSSSIRIHLLPVFGDYPLEKITTAQIEEYKAAKQKTALSPKTINNHLCIISKCLRDAQEWGLIATVPRIRMLRVPPQRFDFLTSYESALLLQDKEEPKWHEMLLVALRTGMRLGELIGLDWSAIDFDRRLIIVRQSIVKGHVGSPKNNRTRVVSITDEVCAALAYRRKKEGLVFPRHDGKPLAQNTARNAILRHCKRVGLRPLGWHALRHTFASQLATEGAPMRAIQDLLGHSTPQMTARYAHLTPAAHQSFVALLLAAEQREMKRFGQPADSAGEIRPKAL